MDDFTKRLDASSLDGRQGGKLLIVNNGLKDLRGHYFETAVSTADAATRAGMTPYLLGHATCRPEMIPSWLEFLPLCRTDHWMIDAPPPRPDMRGIRSAPAGQNRTKIDDVLRGEASLSDYLAARFDPTAPRFRTRLKRGTGALLRRIFGVFGEPRDRPRTGSTGRFVAVTFPKSSAVPPTRRLRRRFRRECQYGFVFQQDLEAALALLDLTAEDHVFLPTAHARELLAIRRVAESLGPQHCPTFHLEFRHAVDFDEADRKPRGYYTAMHSLLFDVYRTLGHCPQIRLYTDTEELTEVYQELSRLPFGTLPIPFRTDLITPRARQRDEAITLTMLGDVRDEKGFHRLPDLVAALAPLISNGRIRFAIQASLIEPKHSPRSVAALARLKDMSGPNVVLHGLDGPLHPDQYFDLLSQADVMLCPYDAAGYRRRSSGVLTEAIAAGIPTVLTAGTWLERQQPRGTGEAFSSPESFVDAVRKVIADYPTYHARAQEFRTHWLGVHTPDNLVRALLDPSVQVAPAPLSRVA